MHYLSNIHENSYFFIMILLIFLKFGCKMCSHRNAYIKGENNVLLFKYEHFNTFRNFSAYFIFGPKYSLNKPSPFTNRQYEKFFLDFCLFCKICIFCFIDFFAICILQSYTAPSPSSIYNSNSDSLHGFPPVPLYQCSKGVQVKITSTSINVSQRIGADKLLISRNYISLVDHKFLHFLDHSAYM